MSVPFCMLYITPVNGPSKNIILLFFRANNKILLLLVLHPCISSIIATIDNDNNNNKKFQYQCQQLLFSNLLPVLLLVHNHNVTFAQAKYV